MIVANISNTVKYLLACNLGEVFTILGAVSLGNVSPLLPVQILWVNLVTDSLPALALAAGPPSHIAPARQVSILERKDMVWMGMWAVLVGGVSLVAYGFWGR